MEHVYMWKEMLAPSLLDMSGHLAHHAFLFRRLDDGTVGMRSKPWQSFGDWQGKYKEWTLGV
jgi:hypothetical protein